MSHPKHNEFEELFKTSFEGFEELPSAAVWSGLDQRLDGLAEAGSIPQDDQGALQDDFAEMNFEPNDHVWDALSGRLDALIPEAPGQLAEEFADYQPQPSASVWTGLSDQLNGEASDVAARGHLKHTRRLQMTMAALVVLLFLSLGLGSYILWENQQGPLGLTKEISYEVGNSKKSSHEELAAKPIKELPTSAVASDLLVGNSASAEQSLAVLSQTEIAPLSPVSSSHLADGQFENETASTSSASQSVLDRPIEGGVTMLVSGFDPPLESPSDLSTSEASFGAAPVFVESGLSNSVQGIESIADGILVLNASDDRAIEAQRLNEHLYALKKEEQSQWLFSDFSFKKPTSAGGSRWSVTPSITYASNYRNLSSTEEGSGQEESVYTEEFFNQSESADLSLSAGAHLNFEISRLFSLRTGLLLDNWNMNSSYDIFVRTESSNIYAGNHYASNNTSTIEFTLEENLGVIGELRQVKMSVKQQLRFLRIPLELELGVAKANWGLLARAGLSWNQLLSHRLSANENGDIDDITQSNNTHLRSYVSWQTALVLRYSISERLSLEMSPVLSRGLTPMNTGQAFEVQPFSYGMNTGLKIKF